MRKQILVTLLLSVFFVMVAVGIASQLYIKSDIAVAKKGLITIADIAAKHIDRRFQDQWIRLYDIASTATITPDDGLSETEITALERAYAYSIFSHGIFILNASGSAIASYPNAGVEHSTDIPSNIRDAVLSEKRPMSYVHLSPNGDHLIYFLVPFSDLNGRPIGVMGGIANLSSVITAQTLLPRTSHTDVDLALSDSTGHFILYSDTPDRPTCSNIREAIETLITKKESTIFECQHPRSHIQHVVALSALPNLPFAIAAYEPSDLFYAHTHTLKNQYITLGILFLSIMITIAVGLGRSFALPLARLSKAVDTMMTGNLDVPITIHAPHEIGELSRHIENMRQRTVTLLSDIQKINNDLENRVQRRTDQLKKSEHELAIAIKKIIVAQEEERERVARELHDETSQQLAVLGMDIDMAISTSSTDSNTHGELVAIKQKVETVMDGISRLIRDLRPPILSDLGLHSALKWVMERYITPSGANANIHLSAAFKSILSEKPGLDPKAELMLFRIVQEGVINISKHAHASHVDITIDCIGSDVSLSIIDDGAGFDVNSVWQTASSRERGFGLMGMRERVYLLGGRISVSSESGHGTRISIHIPMQRLKEKWDLSAS